MDRTPRMRRYTSLPGSPPSATGILGNVFPKPDLEAWKREQAVLLGREYPDDEPKRLLERRQDRQGLGRGSRVHENIAASLKGTGLGPDLDVIGAKTFGLWGSWWMSTDYEPLLIEEVAWNRTAGYAGTLDCLALHPESGERVLLDWKTARRLPDEAYLDHVAQLVAYSQCLVQRGSDEWQPMGRIDSLVVVYIAAEGVREFRIDADELRRGTMAWDASLQMARALWPSVFPAALVAL